MQKKLPLVTVLDSSAWVKIARSKVIIFDIRNLVDDNKLIIFASKYLYDEIEHALSAKLGLTKQQAKAKRRLIEKITNRFEPKNIAPICRDPADDPIIALALEAGAEYLVSVDNDILEMINYKNCAMIDLSIFINQVK